MIKLGLIGRNINYSLSPKIHQIALSCLGVKGTYCLFDKEERELESFLSKSWQEGIHGLNITSPYKKVVAELFPNNAHSAVNVLFRGQNNWVSASTDSEGFNRSLEKMDCELNQFNKVVILGAGGVLPAILHSFQETKPSIHILRRAYSTDTFLNEINTKLTFHEWQLESLRPLLEGETEDTILIQASSAPLRGDSLECFVPAMKGFQGVFVDLVYGCPSKLFFEARDKKLKHQDGLPMLIEQARLSQELWFGKSADYKEYMKFLKDYSV